VALSAGLLVGSALGWDVTICFWVVYKVVVEVPDNDSASWSNESAGGNGSALKGATGVRMAVEVPGSVSASWRSLGF
jgi:hypothetical protein